MTYGDATFDGAVDKGTLDAMLSSAASGVATGEAMLQEIIR